ncbi:hypothetical protein, partial [Melghirimyces profundicolus]|uniref:hypothetical protein n=1 Tax=Melghirimyces profundicolus TaxID=1242148 RepID=UPI000D38EB26
STPWGRIFKGGNKLLNALDEGFESLSRRWSNGGASGGAKANPYDIAKNGGKHKGFYKQYVEKTDEQIQKGIDSLNKQIQEHRDKIKNPEKYIPHFKELDPRQQNALINKKWPGDIQRQMEQKAILEGILKSRRY